MKLEAISGNGTLWRPTNPSDWDDEGARTSVRYSE